VTGISSYDVVPSKVTFFIVTNVSTYKFIFAVKKRAPLLTVSSKKAIAVDILQTALICFMKAF
jgi:hypothetical protein